MMKRLFFILLYFSAIRVDAQIEQTPPAGTIVSLAAFKKLILADPGLRMTSIQKIVPDVRIDLKYATTDNFTCLRMYPAETNSTFLREAPCQALAQVAAELKAKGLGIKIWDAYRPYRVTVRFWKLIHDERYVANPSKGSGHNRGIAIDLTLYNLNTGRDLNMPTGFDNFSERAHHGFMQLEEEQIRNRELLKSVMEKFGFICFATEWWHYYWPGAEKYALLDLNFRQLNHLQ